jgi:hypothetical protein
MESNFVPYQQSLVLKELGFNEPCLAKHDLKHILLRIEECKNQENAQEFDYILAPTYSQAFRWFRENHSLIAYPVWGIDNTWDMNIQKLDNYRLLSGQSTLAIIKKPTYEEAESACLDKLIEICKNK